MGILRRIRKNHALRSTMVFVFQILSESGDFKQGRFHPSGNLDHPKCFSDGESIRKDSTKLLRIGVGRNVQILDLTTQQKVSDTSSDDVGDIALIIQFLKR